MCFALDCLLNFVNLKRDDVTQLLCRRITLVFLDECIGGILKLVTNGNLTLRPTYHIAIFCNSLKDALTNPPDSIRDKLKTTRFVNLVCSSDKTNITFVNQVC